MNVKLYKKIWKIMLLEIHDSITKAGESIGLTRHAVNKVCIGKNKTTGGYKWEYENQENNYILDVDLTNAKQIKDFENYYIFSNGKIFNKQRKSFMKDCINAHGSHYITLSKSRNEKSNKYVHNLVATYFIDNPNNITRVRHIDKNKDNNNYNNLEWF